MFTGLKKMFKYKILAVNGEIGKVEDFYFDERFNTIRYLVVNTGGFLFKNLVLISPVFINKVFDDEKLVKVNLTKDEIENSPDVDTEKPVSRLYEKEFFKYYKTSPYWTGFLTWGAAPVPVGLKVPEETGYTKERDTEDDKQHFLRSVNEIFGYKCETRDGRIGYIKDFRIEPESWRIETFLMTAKHLAEGDEIEFDMRWIDRFSYNDKRAYLDLAIKELDNILL
ncbi:MAG: PRC-barrel domain-containing protein [Spirochaetales bacterium]|nr:PRC-barrel domain-containing protein [Spirochaetales bacterium]